VIVGDIDGVLVIPAEHLADIVAAAVAKVDGEATVRRMISPATGRRTCSARPESCSPASCGAARIRQSATHPA